MQSDNDVLMREADVRKRYGGVSAMWIVSPVLIVVHKQATPERMGPIRQNFVIIGKTALVRNQKELEEQSHWLSRRLGALRPYIKRFDSEWLMNHPATGVRWDALDAATGLTSVSQIKGPSLRSTIEKLNTIAGRLEALDPNDSVPSDRGAPLRSGLGPDRLMMSYLDHLHPYIAKGCSRLFVDEHYARWTKPTSKSS
jgi:hypothetical protein